MGDFFTELGKKLAERWLSVLALPGLLYFGALAAAQALGHAHAFAPGRLTARIDSWTTPRATTTVGGVVMILTAVLLAAAGAGLVTQALGSLTERMWFADHWMRWPRPVQRIAGRRTKNRQKAWDTAIADYQRILEDERRARAYPHDTREPARVGVAQAYQRVTRIAQEQPVRPTWIGDRLHAVITRVDRDYDLDAATVWPHLWLVMPETTRTEIIAARDAVTRAATLAGWAVLYLAIAAVWWPGLFIPVALATTACRRARGATDTYALLIEAAIRLHTTDLVRALGIDHNGPLDKQTGWTLTCLLQGQTHLIPLTTGWPTSTLQQQPPNCDQEERPGTAIK